MAFQYHRNPAVPRKISRIEPEKDVRVRILGKIFEKTPNGFIIDDGSTKEVVVEQEFMNSFDVGDVVRIFARVLPLEHGFELRAEIIQNMNELDLELYKKVMEK